MPRPEVLAVSPKVREALAGGRPVVALEANLIAHALPFPDNAAAAGELAGIVDAAGAEPAFVAVADGAVRVGLSDEEIDRLARAPRVAKVGPGDVGAALAAGSLGATTVAVTMHAAARAGIEVMATGGIGGVHRGYADSHDASPDLTALARTPVAVVCSGAKSILDVGRTLEALETLGVAVFSYRSDDFAGYETRSSGFAAAHRFDDPAALAQALSLHFAAQMGAGAVVANPVPAEFEADPAAVEAAIEAGLEAAERQGLRGKRITPFLLDEMARATAGESRRAAVELTKANAELAARLAVHLAAL